MRDRLLDSLEPTRYRRFLVYVMGAYKAHDIENEAAFAFLERVRDGLRSEGFNAFLATDVGIELDEMDAGTQSLEFARASNAVIFVVRNDGRNLGVGIETGAVLEDMSDRARERVLFLHEAGVQSAMIAAVADRWDATVRTFDAEDDLYNEARLFIRDVMRRETSDELPFPPESD
ncbi:DUF7509 family protein [Halococcus thailandensis]|uniref:DUF7509 domain-containing protein n=1 Tax=Halococcus thailandensis JCM 13552 TaxID=1227457 RepID=M0MWW4_9EURY|nr:hypothetical protein [Halococcus thailandensis]EMA50227.1 hypothetical protein C451_17050 [Halococcus thailandensis JCM 13552]